MSPLRFRKAGRVVFVRHGQSQWNITDAELGLTARFTGWVDIDLTNKGIHQAKASGVCLREFNIKPDAIYTSLLKRSIRTLDIMGTVSDLNQHGKDVSVINSWRLNERHYGALTGLPKAHAGKLYGESNLSQWRRSWDMSPPPLHREDHMDLISAMNAQPTTMIKSFGRSVVARENKATVPATESLKDCAERVLPLWNYGIAPRVLRGETVLVVAHANSIRSLLKCIEGHCITVDTVRNINIPSAIPLVYNFAASVGDYHINVDEIPDLIHPNTQDHVLATVDDLPDSRKTVQLVPLGAPSLLGLRGRYIANKELIEMDLGTPKDSKSNFFDLSGRTLQEAVEYSESTGKDDALVITDKNGIIVHSNEAWTTLCGFTSEDVKGRTNAFLQGPLSDKNELKKLDEKVATGLPVKSRIINYRKNGNAFLNELTLIPLYDSFKNNLKSNEVGGEGATMTGNIVKLEPTHFVAKLSPTPDRLDLPKLTHEEISQRDTKYAIPSIDVMGIERSMSSSSQTSSVDSQSIRSSLSNVDNILSRKHQIVL